MKDPVNPDYYDSVFDQILENKFSTEDLIKIDEFNVFKYIYRWRNKNGLQDLKKARWYLNSMIEKIEKFQEKEKHLSSMIEKFQEKEKLEN